MLDQGKYLREASRRRYQIDLALHSVIYLYITSKRRYLTTCG